MKRNISFIVFLVILFVLTLGIFVIYANNNKKNKEIEKDVKKAIPSDLLNFGFYHIGTAEKCIDKSCEDYEYQIIYRSYIKGEVNIEDINVNVKDKKITLLLPNFKITDYNYETLEAFEIDENSNLDINKKNLSDICNKDLKEKANKNDKTIADDSKKISIQKLNDFLKPWVKENYKGYELEIK